MIVVSYSKAQTKMLIHHEFIGAIDTFFIIGNFSFSAITHHFRTKCPPTAQLNQAKRACTKIKSVSYTFKSVEAVS